MPSAVFGQAVASQTKIFTLRQIFEKSCEYAKDVYTCFVNLWKAYDRVPREKLLGVVREYGVDGRLFTGRQVTVLLYSRGHQRGARGRQQGPRRSPVGLF